jgi:hypothetical protein
LTIIPYGFQAVPEDSPDERNHRKQIARAVNLALLGKFNATADLTLGASTTTTTLTDTRITAFSAIVPAMAMTADAAADLAAGIWVSNITPGLPGAGTAGSATINHRNNSAVDRTIRFLIIG